MGEGLFAGGDFAGVSVGENVKIATVNNITDGEVDDNDGNVYGDVGCDNPDAGFEGIFIFDVYIAIPGNHAEDVSTVVALSAFKSVSVGRGAYCGTGRQKNCKSNAEGKEEFFEYVFHRFIHLFISF